jgi:purine-nucleoside/S-methyl-5'-thioadenosine phosphorylase / adenosine deaminase
LKSATWIEASLPNAKAVFSTRLGGVSSGPYAELNLGILTDDDPALVQRNRDLLATAIGRDPDGFAMGLQVHGDSIQAHERRPEQSPYVTRGELVESDAQLTTSPDVTPLVLVADCFPLVVSAPGVIAVVHCGWRGVAAGIVSGALDAVGNGGRDNVTAAIGPGIGPCCYEVGEEVTRAFRSTGPGDALDGDRLDLAGAIRSELERGGVRAVTDLGLCTSCHPELFFSHRRDGGVTGRQAGLAWLRP